MSTRRGIKGKLVMFDGIDGSGKGTLVSALAAWAKKHHLKVFDLRAYNRRHHTLPEPSELKRYDVILSAEPTFSLVGQAIREEIVRHNERVYTAMETAQAYALDRLILYRRVIIPALQAGKYVFQERGFSTSICYQPIQKDTLSIRKILKLEGNQLALRYRPDLLVIVTVDPHLAMRRLTRRYDKKDAAIFEKLHFLQKAQRRFRATWFQKIFTQAGSRVEYIDTDQPQVRSERQMVELWEHYLRSA